MFKHEEEGGELLLIGIAIAVGYVLLKGGIGPALTSIASGAGGAIANAANSASGVPPVDDRISDPHVLRYIIDMPNGGNMAAEKWATDSDAYFAAQDLTPGSGYGPPANSAAAKIFPPLVGPAYVPSLDDPITDWETYFNQSMSTGL